MNRSKSMWKVLMFGLFGALGCLGGWVVGEVFLQIAVPREGAAGSLAAKPALPTLARQAPPPPPPAPPAPAVHDLGVAKAAPAPVPPELKPPMAKTPPPPPEFAKRLSLAGGKSGDVQITLIWFNVNDLDLHCVEPSGNEIFFARRRSRSGGELDVDRNASGPETDRPVENIYWPEGRAPEGTYKVYVNHYANHGGRDPSEYRVSVLANGRRQEFDGQISRGERKRLICEFDVTPSTPELQLAVSPELLVTQGGKNALKLRLAGSMGSGPVQVSLAGDLRGLTPAALTVDADQTEAELEVQADSSALPGDRILVARAASGATSASAKFQLRVIERSPELLMAVSPEVIVAQGGKNQLQVRVRRSLTDLPVHVRLEGAIQGITPGEFDIAASETEKLLEIAADPAAAPGPRTVQVVASAGAARTQTSFELRIQPVDPVLRLALPQELRIDQGGRNELPVRVLREHFTGPVTVALEGNLGGLTPTRFVIPAESDEYEVTLHAADVGLGSRIVQVTAEGGRARAEGELTLVVMPPAATTTSWILVLVIGLWTALLAGGLSAALLIGQNWYLGRPWLSAFEAALLTLGSLVAGTIAGGGGQALYGILNQIHLLPQIGFLAGWLLLGALLGRGVVFFIPNLPRWNATLAGSSGGFIGALAFLAVSASGDRAGRLVGAVILGFAIGLMVALVEVACRRQWLEVRFGRAAPQRVNLGATPVFLGGSAAKCTLVVPGAPQRALKFWESDGEIYCLDLVKEKTVTVAPGERLRLRDAEVTVCSTRERAPVARRKRQSRFSDSADLPTAESPAVPPQTAPAPQKAVPTKPSASRVGMQPEQERSAPAAAAGPCPICGKVEKGKPGQRRCTSCYSVF